MRIKIPFKDRFIIEIASGRKTMTTRLNKKGKIGDTFSVGKGIRCVLLGVERILLRIIMSRFYKQEGFKSRKEFRDFWLTIHRTAPMEKKFYLHTFKRI